MTTFSSIGLPEAMLTNLKKLNFTTMTAVQAHTLGPIFQNKDIIAQAKTGSGKTVAFGIGVLNKLNVEKFKTQALILCPTRELADQVAKVLRLLARFTENIKITTLSGGVPLGPQIGSLTRPPHIVVGTPGRILKHLNKATLSLSTLETLVLDEADRMLDMGFIDDIEKIISFCPSKRQTLLFSATYPETILSLSQSIQTAPIKIETNTEEPPNKVIEYFYGVGKDKKTHSVINAIKQFQPTNVIVFCNTKLNTQTISEKLNEFGIEAIALHGDLEQYQRNDILVQFINHSCLVLVATDVAARGLDIKELGMVINYDLPHDEMTYTHRIGRTARAGEEGIALTLYNEHEAHKTDVYRNKSRRFEKSSALGKNDNTAFTYTAPNATLVIEAGKKDKLRPGDILGALSGDAGIAGDLVGKIDVFEKQSYVAIHRSMIQKAYSKLQQGKIKGRKISVWILSPSHEE